ncbi:MAG: hypothetical protein ACM37Z_02825 [Deltaproteobacteria bacterium]
MPSSTITWRSAEHVAVEAPQAALAGAVVEQPVAARPDVHDAHRLASRDQLVRERVGPPVYEK